MDYKIESKYKQKYFLFIQKTVKKINDRILSYNLPFDLKFYFYDDMFLNDFNEQIDEYVYLSFIDYNKSCQLQGNIPIVIDVSYIYQMNRVQKIKLNYVYKQIQYSLWMNVAQFLIYKLQKQFLPSLPQFDKNYVTEQFVHKKGNIKQSFLVNLLKSFYP